MVPIQSTTAWADCPPDLTLPPAEVHVFAFALDLPMPRVHGLTGLLAPGELTRANRFTQQLHRRRYIVGRARMRAILGHYLGREAKQVRIGQGTNDKPVLEGGDPDPPLRFNASRSYELGMLAVQLHDDVGVDVEYLRPFPDALPIAKRFFSAEEHRALAELGPAARDTAFLRSWTRKEAVVKSLGLGLSHPLDSVRFERLPDTTAERVIIGDGDGPGPLWSLPVPPPSGSYTAALVVQGDLRTARYWRWKETPQPIS